MKPNQSFENIIVNNKHMDPIQLIGYISAVTHVKVIDVCKYFQCHYPDPSVDEHLKRVKEFYHVTD